MSQRLCVGPAGDGIFDCILDSPGNVEHKLRTEWFADDGITFCGPWKVWINDVGLFRKVEPQIESALEGIGEEYPSCLWVVWVGGQKLKYPTREELDDALRGG